MNRQHEVPIVVVQSIVARWTKQSRGGKQAEARNQVPERLELPPTLPEPASAAAMQQVYYGERNHFRGPAYQQWTALETLDTEQMAINLYADDDTGLVMPRLLLSASAGLLHVGFDWMRFYGYAYHVLRKLPHLSALRYG